MARCNKCNGRTFKRTTIAESIEVGGQRFGGAVEAHRCDDCGDVIVSGEGVRRFELAVAAALPITGAKRGAAFRFMRKALGLRAVDLADLLDLAPETISKYENEKIPIDRRALAVLGGLVDDAQAGTTRTRDRLAALKRPPKLAKAPVPIDVGEQQRAGGR